jgi:D-alanine-D-alanine ligase
MDKKRIGVVFGGRSQEYEVSLMSGGAVIKAARDLSDYQVIPLGISREGQWRIFNGKLEDLESDNWEAHSEHLEIGLIKEKVDFILPILHGPYGEDGTIQGLLEMLDIPYGGCGVLASSLAMDKALAKNVFKSLGLPQSKYLFFSEEELEATPEVSQARILECLKFPLFVKPANMGSSVGITKVKRLEDLAPALRNALAYDRRIVVEEGLDCRELEVSVIGNRAENMKVSTIGEILPGQEFYDYKAKYGAEEASKLMIPAQISKEDQEEIKRLALKAFQAIDGQGFARIDFFKDRKSGTIYINEINTIPGFTKYSMMPLLWEASGLSFPQLVKSIVGYGYERYNAKNRR